MPQHSQPGTILKYLQLIFFSAAILYFGKTLFIPLFFGLLVAIILYPVCRWLQQKKIPVAFAITASLSIVLLFFAALVWLFLWQVQVFREDIPALSQKLNAGLPQLQQWITIKSGITLSSQNQWWQSFVSGKNIGAIINDTVSATGNMVFIFLMVPVYAALFLYNRRSFVLFLRSVISQTLQTKLDGILQQTIHTYFNFIKGMAMVYIIVGILNTIGLLALGIKHAFLFGMLAAIMTIIPYVGIIVSALLPIAVAWITKDSIWYPLGVVAVFTIVQYLEANIIFPKVVGRQMNVGTMATLVAIIAGGVLWGVAGMILFIPFLAILKIITDNVKEWSALNILLSR